MIRKMFLVAALLSAGLCQAEEVKVTFPSGNLEVAVSDQGGRASYRIALKVDKQGRAKVVIQPNGGIIAK